MLRAGGRFVATPQKGVGMNRIVGKGGLAALITSIIAVVIAAVGTSSADVGAGSGTKVLTRASTAVALAGCSEGRSFDKVGSRWSTPVKVVQHHR
jgi:hypothetical protein